MSQMNVQHNNQSTNILMESKKLASIWKNTLKQNT